MGESSTRTSRAGRNLPAAIAVGLPLLIVVLLGVLWLHWLLLIVVLLASSLGTWEVARAMGARDIRVPMVPLQLAGLCLCFGTWFFAQPGLAIGLFIATLIVVFPQVFVANRSVSRPVVASIFILLWVPFLLAFALLLLQEPRGNLKLATLLLLVVSNDTFGYLVGALFGRHAMLPTISPKKSWEGFAGSIIGASVIGVLACVFLLQVPWWLGVLFACFTVLAATTGDLAESMIKRELGIKDMSSVLPGHGGIMDRLDSMLFAMPAAYLVSMIMGLFSANALP